MPVTNIPNIAAVSHNTDGRGCTQWRAKRARSRVRHSHAHCRVQKQKTRRGCFDNDPERFLSRFTCPATSTLTIVQIRQSKTYAQYDMMRDVFARLGATDLIRVCVSARFLSLSKVHELLDARQRALKIVVKPRNLLIGGRWMVADSAYAATEASVADALTLTEFSANRQTNDLLTQSASTHTTSNDHEDENDRFHA